MSSKETLFFSVSLVFLGYLAFIRGPELRTDSLVHFLHAKEIIANLDIKSLFTNLWDKPIPIILYGISGQISLFAARMVSVSLTLLAGFFIFRLCSNSVQTINDNMPVTTCFFLFMLPVLPQSYVTNTELPAAFILSLGLFLFYVKRKYSLAYLSIGFLPFARLEASLIMALIFLTFSYHLFILFKKENFEKIYITILLKNIYGSLPFVLWYLIGVILSDNVLWMLQGNYAHLRPLNLPLILQHNAITALPKIFTSPILMIFFLGLLTPFQMKKNYRINTINITMLGILFIHIIFLSMFIVYPKGSVNWEKLISAWNDRNFIVIAPVLAFYVYTGAAFLYSFSKKLANRGLKSGEKNIFTVKVIISYLLTIASIYFCNKHFFLPSSTEKYFILLHATIIFIVAILLFSLKKDIKLNLINLLAMISFLSVFITTPSFWYPTKHNDPDVLICNELKMWLTEKYHNEHVNIVHDISGTLDRFINSSTIKAPWIWPSDFIDTAEKYNGKTLIIFTTQGPKHTISPHYPPNILKFLEKYPLVGKSVSKYPYGWVVFEFQKEI